MQKLDILSVSVGSMVTVNRNGKVYTAKVIRLPLIDKKGNFAKDGFRPTQFKIEVQGDDEYSGNRYVSYTAVHTVEADKNQKSRAEAEAKAKAAKKAATMPKTTGTSVYKQLMALAQMAKIAEDAGLELDLSNFNLTK